MRTRRDFLTAASAAAAAPLFHHAILEAAAENRAADNTQMHIDAHVHVWTQNFKEFPLAEGFTGKEYSPATFTPEELFAHSQPAGVGRIVLIQMSFYKFDNSYMLAAMKKHPGVFSGVAIIDDSKADAPQRMKQLKEQGVRGFRLYTDKAKAESWFDSTSMKSMWSTAADTGQAMCLLANPDAIPVINRMCQLFPRTRVVIDHFARIGMTGTIEQSDLDNLCRLAKFENVYVKTSAFYALGAKKAPYTDLEPMILRLVKEFGAKRLMWASDCPFQVQSDHTYAASIELIRDRIASLTAADKQEILRGTAERVFFS